jgi:hypothetical protein
MIITRRLCVLSIVLILASQSHAQVQHTEHTMKLAEGQKSPAATIQDMAWFAGRWVGDGMGGSNEEHWGPPQGGIMLGTFRHDNKDGKPVFYEFMTLAEREGTISLRLKHFNPDMTGWEEKAKFVEFKLVAKKDGAVFFEGLTFVPKGKEEAIIYLALRSKDKVREEVFHFKRAGN